MLRRNVVLTVTDVSKKPSASTDKVKAPDCMTIKMTHYIFRIVGNYLPVDTV